MPIYEYRCLKCGHRFETIQKVSDPPLTKCEKCKGKAERLLSSPAIQFKGSGWYITDYARKGSSDGAEKRDRSDGKASTSDSSTSDSKSETTSSEKPASKKAKDKAKSGSSAK